MRDILFRGKRVDNYVKNNSIDYEENGVGEWVYGDVIHRRYLNRDVIVIRTEDSGFDNYSGYEVEPLSVGIFTGLYDKNGNKIFEGDILEVHDIRPLLDGYGYEGIHYNGVIKYRENQGLYVCEGSKNGDVLCALNLDACKVIGSVHDNPELLEVK